MWGLNYIPGDEPEFECAVCGVPMFEDAGLCSYDCYLADQM
jgi:predicted nucleic acid-binding Zn ribbon protein